MTSIADFTVTTNRGKPLDLADKLGTVLLVVNTASKCGFTPQYDGLEALYQRFAERGFEVLGFPCNQFGAQEPGDADEIRQFCDVNFNVSFPLFEKIDVNGSGTHPLYDHLKEAAPGLLGSQRIKWNFTKFLVGRDGVVLERFAPTTKPQDIEDRIEAALG